MKKLLTLGIMVCLLAVLAVPAQAMAETTVISGVLQSSVTITAPTGITFSPFSVGTNTAAATAGSIVANCLWNLSVTDAKSNNRGYMTLGGVDSSTATKLTRMLEVGHTTTSYTNVDNYGSNLAGLPGYGVAGTFAVPLYARQVVESADLPGPYQLTITYTVTPLSPN